mgnify:CR=1 FL=1
MPEVLVVTSKIKKQVKVKHQMNTSAEVIEVLSKRVEAALDKAAENAKNDGRKTVMARDFEGVSI